MESFARAVEIVLKESEPRDASGFGPTAVKRSDVYVGVAPPVEKVAVPKARPESRCRPFASGGITTGDRGRISLG